MSGKKCARKFESYILSSIAFFFFSTFSLFLLDINIRGKKIYKKVKVNKNIYLK